MEFLGISAAPMQNACQPFFVETLVKLCIFIQYVFDQYSVQLCFAERMRNKVVSIPKSFASRGDHSGGSILDQPGVFVLEVLSLQNSGHSFWRLFDIWGGEWKLSFISQGLHGPTEPKPTPTLGDAQLCIAAAPPAEFIKYLLNQCSVQFCSAQLKLNQLYLTNSVYCCSN